MILLVRQALLVCFTLLFVQIKAGTPQGLLADSLFKAGNWEAAAKAFEEKIKKEPNPKTGYNYYRLAQCYMKLKQYTKSYPCFYKAINIGKNPGVMYDLACAFSLDFKGDSALVWLKKAADAGFSQYDNMKGDTDFNNIKSDKRFDTMLEKVKANAYPCTTMPEYRQFDFWIGNWKVFNTAGQPAGESRVELILGECVIYENWTGFGGTSGKSHNIYDKATNTWQQTWVDDKGSLTNYFGGMKDGAMVLTTKEYTDNTGNTQMRRMTFTKQDGGDVRQHGELSTDQGKTWKTEFDFFYKKVN